MIDASLAGLDFILYQKDSTGHCSILQVGSTCLKNAQARWHPAELELLAVQYCLNKCHFYIAHNQHQIKSIQLQEITQMQNTRMIQIKANLQMYNHTVSHVKGIKNHLADVLSCRPVWLAPDNSIGPDKGLDLKGDHEFAMRIMGSNPSY